MRKKYKLKENYIVVILFMIFFLFQFIQIFQFKFFVQSDDFGYIANSAFFAGYNWNPYTGDMTPYYNIGFSIFQHLLLEFSIVRLQFINVCYLQFLFGN